MVAATTCPKCNSHNIIQKARVTGEGGVAVEVYENPDAWVFKDAHREALNAVVCGQCGYLELYAENPHELFAIYKRGEKS